MKRVSVQSCLVDVLITILFASCTVQTELVYYVLPPLAALYIASRVSNKLAVRGLALVLTTPIIFVAGRLLGGLFYP